jgi:hypothetical protein
MKALLLLTALSAGVASAQSHIGVTLPPGPSGLVQSKTGACVSGTLGAARDCDYSVGLLEDSKGNSKFVYGARFKGRDAEQKPVWTITDTYPYPSIPSDQYLAMAVCRIGTTMDETIVAVAHHDRNKEWHDRVVSARKLDLATGRFVDLPVGGVSCANVTWGLGELEGRGKDVNAVLQRIPSRIDQLALARVSQASNDWTAYYSWSRGAICVVPSAVSVRVQSHDSVESAEQGIKTNVKMTSVRWTRQEDFRGLRLYVWDTTMVIGEQQLRVGPRILFRVGNDVVNLSTGDKTVGMDFLMKVLEVVADELKSAGK